MNNTQSLSESVKAITIADLIQPVEEHIGCNYMHWPDGGFFNGGINTEVKGVLLTWMAGPSAIKQAIQDGCNVIICHEPLFFHEKNELPPYRWLTPDDGCKEPDWHPNSIRQELILDNNITVFQCHYGLDRYCMYAAFSKALGLDEPILNHGWESVFTLKKTMTVGKLIANIKERLQISGTVRVVGNPDREVLKVACLWGGMGISDNIYWLRRAILNKADVAICGEMNEFFMQFAEDAGFPVIETSHRLSEEYGIASYAASLQEKFPQLNIRTNIQGRPYYTF